MSCRSGEHLGHIGDSDINPVLLDEFGDVICLEFCEVRECDHNRVGPFRLHRIGRPTSLGDRLHLNLNLLTRIDRAVKLIDVHLVRISGINLLPLPTVRCLDPLTEFGLYFIPVGESSGY